MGTINTLDIQKTVITVSLREGSDLIDAISDMLHLVMQYQNATVAFDYHGVAGEVDRSTNAAELYSRLCREAPLYSHRQHHSGPPVGSRVARGEIIAKSGSSEPAGPHLH